MHAARWTQLAVILTHRARVPDKVHHMHRPQGCVVLAQPLMPSPGSTTLPWQAAPEGPATPNPEKP